MDVNRVWENFLHKEDDRYFSILYDGFVEPLYSYGLYLGFNEDQCKDAIQDLFCKLYFSKKRLSHITHITAYLYRAYKNRLLDMYRQSSRYESLDNVRDVFSIKATVIEDLMDKEEALYLEAKMNTLLNNLTAKQRMVIYMRYMQQLSYAEIGEALEINPDSCKKMVYRAIDKLRSLTKKSKTPE